MLSRQRRLSAYRLGYLCTCATLTAVVLFVFLYKPGINGYARAMFADMVYGTAWRPFVYRTLLPTSVRLLASAVPAETRAELSLSLGERQWAADLCRLLGWETEYLTEYLIATVLMCLCLWGFVWALRYLLVAVYEVPRRIQDAFLLVALLGLTQFFHYYSYVYDFPALFLFTLGLAGMCRRKWGWYLPLYAAACVNKETAVLLAVVFAVHCFDRARLPRKRYLALLAAQLGLFAGIKTGLSLVFRDNPGSFVEVHLFDHNLALIDTYPLYGIFAWGGFALLVFYRWSEKPLFLRQALWIAVPLVVLTALFGFLNELRDYYEVYPVVVLLALHSLGRVLRFEVRTRRPDLTAAAAARSPAGGEPAAAGCSC